MKVFTLMLVVVLVAAVLTVNAKKEGKGGKGKGKSLDKICKKAGDKKEACEQCLENFKNEQPEGKRREAVEYMCNNCKDNLKNPGKCDEVKTEDEKGEGAADEIIGDEE